MQETQSTKKAMGFEVESSAFKIKIDPNREKKKNILLDEKDKKEIIQIEEDSMDYQLDKTELSAYDRNLEIKTINGYQKEKIVEIARDVQEILQNLRNKIKTTKNVIIHDNQIVTTVLTTSSCNRFNT